MATGHISPGYGEPVSMLKPARLTGLAGYPLASYQLKEIDAKYKLDESDFDRIRSQARQVWSRKDREPTTYQHYHYGHGLNQDGRTLLRPISPTRKNNPHPTKVFLTNRLHYIEGYHNPDTTLGKPCYQLDSSLSPEGQAQRVSRRRKYATNRPATALINTFKDKYGVRAELGPEDAQAAEAWLQIADDKDKNDVMLAIHNQKEREALSSPGKRRVHMNTTSLGPRAQTSYPSFNSWMNHAGTEEKGTLQAVLRPPNAVIGYESEMRARDIEGTRRVKHCANNDRGDFLIHPDWPSSIRHHRVPCTFHDTYDRQRT